jgi:sugar phosphate isomerase/epimerase
VDARGGSLDRRAFLAALPAAAVGLRGLAARDFGLGGVERLHTLGVQLYTVRTAMVEDADRTLAAIAEIGYGEVELAGLYGMTPREMRAKLDAVGLRAASSHQSMADIRGDWDAVLSGAGELGQELIVCPSIPSEERTPEGLRRVADDFNRAGEAARAAGLRFGYHNHSWEFERGTDGTLPYDLLLEWCDADLVHMQLDIYWAVDGGADPLAIIEANPGRVRSAHVKDRSAAGEMVDVGAGVIDFRAILPRAEELGLRHAFVEHDWPEDPVASVAASYRGLAEIPGLVG